MIRLTTSIIFISCLFSSSVMAFGTTTDFVVRTLYASKQVTSSMSMDKIVQEARGDAASFVASEGDIRGAHIEAAFKYLREQNTDLQVSDIELAKAILTQ